MFILCYLEKASEKSLYRNRTGRKFTLFIPCCLEKATKKSLYRNRTGGANLGFCSISSWEQPQCSLWCKELWQPLCAYKTLQETEKMLLKPPSVSPLSCPWGKQPQGIRRTAGQPSCSSIPCPPQRVRMMMDSWSCWMIRI